MIKYIFTGIIFLFLSVFSFNGYSQSAKKVQKTVDKRQEQLDKQESDKKEKIAQESDAKKQRHLDLQTKKVKKRMKKAKKKSKRINDNKREFFLVRWFK